MKPFPSPSPCYPIICLLTPLLLLSCSATTQTKPSAVSTPQVIGLPTIEPVSGTGPLASSTSKKFTFVAFGDNQGDTLDPTVMQRIFTDMVKVPPNTPKPAFVLSLGDVVHGKDPNKTTATIKASFNAYVSHVGNAGVPVFNAPGNPETKDQAFYHYLLFTVDDTDVHVTIRRIDTN